MPSFVSYSTIEIEYIESTQYEFMNEFIIEDLKYRLKSTIHPNDIFKRASALNDISAATYSFSFNSFNIIDENFSSTRSS